MASTSSLAAADDIRIAYVTAPPAEAVSLAREAVRRKLVACAQLSAPMTSMCARLASKVRFLAGADVQYSFEWQDKV
jgi:uncharacterized metal-binding protein YceD (DUF177 family)